jgi:hypothetical protein
VILAEAYRDAETIKGEGDAKATQIYAQSFGKNPEFYRFYRSMEAYRATFKGRSDVLVLDSNSEFFKYFKGPGNGKWVGTAFAVHSTQRYQSLYPSSAPIPAPFSVKIVDSAQIRVQSRAHAVCCPIFNNSHPLCPCQPGYCPRISPTSCRPKRARSRNCAA